MSAFGSAELPGRVDTIAALRVSSVMSTKLSTLVSSVVTYADCTLDDR